MILDGQILGVVRRDKRPIWQKLRDRIAFHRRNLSAKMTSADQMDNDTSLADCCA